MKVMSNSVPKCGTNLLFRLLMLLGFENAHWWMGPYLVDGQFSLARKLLRARGHETVTIGIDTTHQINSRWLRRRISATADGAAFNAHCPYTPELADLLRAEQIRTVGIIRDPRSVAISHMHYLKSNPRHPLHKAYLNLADDHERVLLSIRGGEIGGRYLHSLEQRYRMFMGWQQDSDALLIRFEDLVGANGGGSAITQRKTIEQVALHLGCNLDKPMVSSLQENLFGSSNTFRKGQIGAWETELSDEHEQVVKEMAGDLLVELGYEEGSNW